MKILFIEWESYGRHDIKEAFIEEGHQLISFSFPISTDFYSDPETEARLISVLHGRTPDVVFSTNYFPLISDVCEKEGIRYICWLYDSPCVQLYTKSITNPCNRIYIFDKITYQEFRDAGIHAVHYLPLAANVKRLDQVTGTAGNLYKYDVSFVGSLYLEKSDLFDQMQIRISDYARGYLDAVMASQMKIQGYNLIEGMLGAVTKELCSMFPMRHQPDGLETDEYLYAYNIICPRITAIERVDYLDAIAQKHLIDLYTYYKDYTMVNVCNHGIADYENEMPCVFRQSRINLNITLRSIRSGIPLRAFDIMGSGGFLLSNFQADFLDFFVPGEDFVYYENKEDLIKKVDYYLSHEDERKQIAKNGHDKVASEHTYRHRVREMLSV